jgi:thiol-disulfide isomerase/thioredoxin
MRTGPPSRSSGLRLAVVCLLVVGVAPAGAQARGPEVGVTAPEVVLDRLGGGRVDLADLRGRPVIINFWATWCGPCRSEMPTLISTWEEQRDFGLEVLAVNLTDQERRKDITRFVEALRIPFPVLLDRRGQVRERYVLFTLPTTVFVDSGGLVRALHPGPLGRDDLAHGLATILPDPIAAPR